MWTLFQTKCYGAKSGSAGDMIAKAGCIASSLEGAFAAFNLWDERVVWTNEYNRPWSASIGDILMAPNGIAHKVERIGFSQVFDISGISFTGDISTLPVNADVKVPGVNC